MTRLEWPDFLPPDPGAPARSRDQVAETIGYLLHEGITLPRGARVLDIGCGEGHAVDAWRSQGFESAGCDIEIRATSSGLSEIELDPYRLPYEDQSFDLVVSHQVLEHVMDLPSFVRETHRVLSPSGFGIHVFPSRWMFLEPHTNVPLGTMLRGRGWLYGWALVGTRNEFQKGWAPAKKADVNQRFLTSRTSYPPGRALRRAFLSEFGRAWFSDAPALPGEPPRWLRAGLLRRALAVYRAGLMKAYRLLGTRVLIVVKREGE